MTINSNIVPLARDESLSNTFYHCANYYYLMNSWQRGYPNTSSVEDLNGNNNIIGFSCRKNKKKNPLKRFSIDHKEQIAVIKDLFILKDNSITQLHPNLIERMGKPLDIPLHNSLSWNNTNVGESSTWLDTRGTVAYIGRKHVKLVENSGKRVILSCNNFQREFKKRRPLKYSLQMAKGKKAAQQGNFFLYRQKIKAYDINRNIWFHTTWVGLATCTYLYKAKDQIGIDVFCQNITSAQPSFTSALIYTPFDRWINNTPKNIDFNIKDWNFYEKQTIEDYTTKPSENIFSALNLDQTLNTTPLGMMVARLERIQQDKTLELSSLTKKLKKIKKDLEKDKIALKKEQLAFDNAVLRIRQLNNEIPIWQSEINNLAPKADQHKVILDRIDSQVLIKKQLFETKKQQYIKNIGSNIPNYAAGLAKSGIVIDELIYQKRTGWDRKEQKRASEYPEITTDTSNWVLKELHAHTTKPIPIVFGLAEKKLPPRISGPHKIKLSIENGQVLMTIACLTPWSVVGIFKNNYFKPFPHVGALKLSTHSLTSFSKSKLQEFEVCLGVLGATAAKAFRNNNPKELTMCILSFLQSVDPTDVWGKTYKNFPLASELKKLETSKLTNTTNNKIPIETNYFTNLLENKYWSFFRKGDQFYIRSGKLITIDDKLFETTANTTTIAHESYNNPLYYLTSGSQSKGIVRCYKFVQKSYKPTSNSKTESTLNT